MNIMQTANDGQTQYQFGDLPLSERSIRSLKDFRKWVIDNKDIVIATNQSEIVNDYIALLDEVIRLRDELLNCDGN